jgi:hypothetical protein
VSTQPSLGRRHRRLAAPALALFLGLSATSALAVLPQLPRGDNAENIVFQDDFDYNTTNANVNAPSKGWSNVVTTPATGKATIGTDPINPAVTAWYPSINSNGTGVTSLVTLPAGLDVRDGPIAAYMRMRLDATTGGYNNAILFRLFEKAPSTTTTIFQYLPGGAAYLFASPQNGFIGTYVLPNTSTYVDFRMVLTSTGANTMKVEAFRYDTVNSTYVSLGSKSGVATNANIFDRLDLTSYNSATGTANRAYFDSVMVTQVGSPRADIPANATVLLGTSTISAVQAALDAAPHVVVLGPGQLTGAGSLTLNSGYRLYGSPLGSRIPTTIITPGATGVVMDTLTFSPYASLNFPSSATVTSGNVFANLNGSVVVTDGTLSDNLFFGIVGAISIKTPTVGRYARNNRFIRCRLQSSWPQVVMEGDSARNSYGNVFLWYNFLTPHGDATRISDQGDLTLVGTDSEAWNEKRFGNDIPINQEIWTNIGNATTIDTIPVGRAPDSNVSLPTFEIPVNSLDNYGVRIRGFFVAPDDGDYTFWISSDDNSALYLSTNDREANKQLIASVPVWTASRQWDKFSVQHNATPIHLLKDQRYYIEALMKEGGVGDNLAVAYKRNDPTNPPNGAASASFIIPASLMRPYANSLFRVARTGTFRLFTTSGGNGYSYATGDFDIDADEFQIFNDYLGTEASYLTDYKLGTHNLRSLAINIRNNNKLWTSYATNPFRVRAFQDWEGSNTVGVDFLTSNTSALTFAGVTPVWNVSTGALGSGDAATLTNMLAPASRLGAPWERPNFGPIPDPAGPNWATLPDRSVQPDDAPALQAMINAGTTIPAGTYYIGTSLKLKNHQGLIGSGADTTVIIAKSSTLDMIIADDIGAPANQPTGRTISIADITLQGGLNGLHLEPIGTATATLAADGVTFVPITFTTTDSKTGLPVLNAARAQYTSCYINHVTFRNMATAGIFLDQIYAIDNNVMRYINFVNCGTGLKQKTDPLYSGGDAAGDQHAARMMYLDKNAFYKCQFVNNGIAMDLRGGRGCHLDAWISCLFKDNAGGVAGMNSYVSPVFANCDFVNNGAYVSGSTPTAAINNNNFTSIVSCDFDAGVNGTNMLGGAFSVEGSTFTKSGNANARMVRSSNGKVFFHNNISDVPLWSATTNTNAGVFTNNSLVANPALNVMATTVKGTTQYNQVATPSAATPQPQMLWGSDWRSAATFYPLLSEF